jgi:hypothetical protein
MPMTITDDLPAEISPAALDRSDDRRRPGRGSDVHPDLLPVYRGIVPDAADDDEDGMRPARGIMFGLMLGAACWGVIGAVVVAGRLNRFLADWERSPDVSVRSAT